MLGVDRPLSEVFVGLYYDGKSGSEPETAGEIVFGEVLPDAVSGAEKR